MADTTVTGPPADRKSTAVTKASVSYTGAGATWEAGTDLLLDPPARAVRCGVGGSLHVDYACGFEDTIPGVLAGEIVDGEFKRIYADSTVEDISIKW